MEIGSEYWCAMSEKGQQEIFLSGRTALEYIVRNILAKHYVTSVLMPSYCCHTMIEPFIRHGIEVRFYDVCYDTECGLYTKIPMDRENEIFYYMTYFGFGHIAGIDCDMIRHRYSVIINDTTHSWLSGRDDIFADYTYTSYRKWNGFSGMATAVSINGDFLIPATSSLNMEYIMQREKASALKRKYIETGEGEKRIFLDMFKRAEEMLGDNYVGFRPSYKAIGEFLGTDWVSIAEKRRSNAATILAGLREIPQIQPIFNDFDDHDVPLFVPVLVKNDRNGLRKRLIEQQIYCPVHWPLSELHSGISERASDIYEHEISLICDQRYNEHDMAYIIDAIRKYYMVRK